MIDVHKGHIKWFDFSKGIGFITSDDGSDFFVHRSAFRNNPLPEGQRVEFTSVKEKKGPKAVDVKKIDNEPVNKSVDALPATPVNPDMNVQGKLAKDLTRDFLLIVVGIVIGSLITYGAMM